MNCVFLTLFLFASQLTCLYVPMREGIPKCFISEVPSDTLIVGTFAAAPLLNEVHLGKTNYLNPSAVCRLLNKS